MSYSWLFRFRSVVRILPIVVVVFLILGSSGCMASLVHQAAAASAACDPANSHGHVGGNGGHWLLALPNEDLGRELDAARAAGMRYMRVDVDWSQIEPVRGQRDWSNTDRVINAIVARGMCPLGLVTYTPLWAANSADHPTDTHFRPSNPNEFAKFAKDAASRYLDRIAVWEVWNEPNSADFFKPVSDVASYANLLAAVYNSIKSVSSSLFVISGGLAPAQDNGKDIAPLTFIKGLYSMGANRYFDAFAMHPYTFPALPYDPTTSSWSAFQQLLPMRDIMVGGGDIDKLIWLTEFGAPTGTAPVAVTEDVQAQTVSIVLLVARVVEWFGPAFVYSIRDAGTDQADIQQNFGILRRDFTPKQAYGMVSQFGWSSQ